MQLVHDIVVYIDVTPSVRFSNGNVNRRNFYLFQPTSVQNFKVLHYF